MWLTTLTSTDWKLKILVLSGLGPSESVRRLYPVLCCLLSMFLCTDFPPYTSHSMSMLLCLLGHQSCGRSLWLHHSYYCQHFICKYYVYITPTPLSLLQVLLCTLSKFIIYFFYCFQYICIYMYIYTCMSNLLTSLSFDPMFMCQGLTTWDGKPLCEAAPRANWLFLFQ